MTPQDLIKYHKEICSAAADLVSRKNNDYANPGTKTDPLAPFKNFMLCEKLDICSTEAGILTRLTDKLARLSHLVQDSFEQQVKDESITDTAMDLINYTILLLAYRKAIQGVDE